MRKLLFSAYSLDIGGIETALVALLNELAKKNYEITLILEKKKGIFLSDLDKKIKIIEYTPSNNKNVLIRKIENFIKRLKFIIKNKNKYDFSVSYATYSLPCSFLARVASKNNALWVHSNYWHLLKNNRKDFINFFNKICVRKFKNIIFVSNDSKEAFIKEFNYLQERCYVINNVIDYKKILKLSNEKVIDYKKEMPTILYVGRLTEEDKKISRIIKVADMLNKDKMNFRILVIGDGKDKQEYLKKVKELNLNDKIIFLGKKKNPYPYFKCCDFLILTSEYEGSPVVFNEAKILNLPILTTDVSDSKEIIKNYGFVTKKDINDIYEYVKKMINNKYIIKENFDVERYNNTNIKLLENIIKC